MNKEINDFKNIISDDYNYKYPSLKKHLYLNILIYDEDYYLRCKVTQEGYYHDILQHDGDYRVRYYVAYYTKDKSILERLSNDKTAHIKNLAKDRLLNFY